MSSSSGELDGFVKSDVPVKKDYLVCQQIKSISSTGIWVGDDPFDFTLPTFLAEVVILTVFTKLIYYLLKPLHQSLSLAQVVVRSFVKLDFCTSSILVMIHITNELNVLIHQNRQGL